MMGDEMKSLWLQMSKNRSCVSVGFMSIVRALVGVKTPREQVVPNSLCIFTRAKNNLLAYCFPLTLEHCK